MRRLLIRPQARLDLLEIWHYIAQDSIENANHAGEALEAAIRLLLETPGIGHTRSDVRDQRYRFWKVYSYIVAYRYDDRALTVVRVIHGRRDFRKALRLPH